MTATTDGQLLREPTNGHRSAVAATITHVRRLIENGEVRPGDRLAPERELARQAGVGRPGVREGLRALAAMGIIRARPGAGTFISAGPLKFAGEVLGLLSALHGFTQDGVLEARRVLERGTGALAAERASGDQIAAIADEVTGMFASLEDPKAFLQHDLGFHRAVAAGANNPILAALLEMILSRCDSDRGSDQETRGKLRESANRHQSIYRAIKDRDMEQVRAAIEDNLEGPQPAPGLGPRAQRTPGRLKCRQAATRP